MLTMRKFSTMACLLLLFLMGFKSYSTLLSFKEPSFVLKTPPLSKGLRFQNDKEMSTFFQKPNIPLCYIHLGDKEDLRVLEKKIYHLMDYFNDDDKSVVTNFRFSIKNLDKENRLQGQSLSKQDEGPSFFLPPCSEQYKEQIKKTLASFNNSQEFAMLSVPVYGFSILYGGFMGCVSVPFHNPFGIEKLMQKIFLDQFKKKLDRRKTKMMLGGAITTVSLLGRFTLLSSSFGSTIITSFVSSFGIGYLLCASME